MPSPTHTNHSGRAAAAKSDPSCVSAVPVSEPHSATPMLTPTCLLVDVTADAAPARSRGIPLTAALVTGALTIEKPIPKTVIRTPAVSSDGRAPYRPTRRPDSGENNSAPTAIGK